MVLVPHTSGRHGESPATQSHQMPSVTAAFLVLLSLIQLLFAQRLEGPRAQFLAMYECSKGRHLHRMGPADFEGTRAVAGDPV